MQGTGFSFAAPASWKVTRSATGVSAAHGQELVEVSRFPLQKAYTDTLFARVATELRSRMQAVAQQSGGTVSGTSTVTAAGVRSHSFSVESSGHVDEYTFVLRGKREYQLLCRRQKSHDAAVCRQLVSSLRLL